MRILVSGASRPAPERPAVSPAAFPANSGEDRLTRRDGLDRPIELIVGAGGISGTRGGARLSLPEWFARIRNTQQAILVLDAHELVAGEAGEIALVIRPPQSAGAGTGEIPLLGPGMGMPGGGDPAERLADCGAVGCGAVGCAAAGGGAGGCGAVGCAAAGCGAVGCGTVGCGAAGKGGGGCAAAGCGAVGCAAAACGAVGCAAAGCAAAACGAVACAGAVCATVACGAATGVCGGAACALDSLCGANAGWPP